MTFRFWVHKIYTKVYSGIIFLAYLESIDSHLVVGKVKVCQVGQVLEDVARQAVHEVVREDKMAYRTQCSFQRTVSQRPQPVVTQVDHLRGAASH
jgi:hypothetical protein